MRLVPGGHDPGDPQADECRKTRLLRASLRDHGPVQHDCRIPRECTFCPRDKRSTDEARRYSRLLRPTVSLFDPFQELLIILLFDPVGAPRRADGASECPRQSA